MPIATPEVYAEMLDRAKAGRFAYPADQRHLVADPERRAARASPTPAATASSRSPPAARSTSPARPSRTWSPGRWRFAAYAHEVAKNYPVNIALHTDHCPKDKLDGFVRPLLALSKERVDRGEAAAVPVAHVGRLGRAAGREPRDRRGAARECAAAK